jgi:hypothetical protein
MIPKIQGGGRGGFSNQKPPYFFKRSNSFRSGKKVLASPLRSSLNPPLI